MLGFCMVWRKPLERKYASKFNDVKRALDWCKLCASKLHSSSCLLIFFFFSFMRFCVLRWVDGNAVRSVLIETKSSQMGFCFWGFRITEFSVIGFCWVYQNFLDVCNIGFQTHICLLVAAMMKSLTNSRARLLWPILSAVNLFAIAGWFMCIREGCVLVNGGFCGCLVSSGEKIIEPFFFSIM